MFSIPSMFTPRTEEVRYSNLLQMVSNCEVPWRGSGVMGIMGIMGGAADIPIYRLESILGRHITKELSAAIRELLHVPFDNMESVKSMADIGHDFGASPLGSRSRGSVRLGRLVIMMNSSDGSSVQGGPGLSITDGLAGMGHVRGRLGRSPVMGAVPIELRRLGTHLLEGAEALIEHFEAAIIPAGVTEGDLLREFSEGQMDVSPRETGRRSAAAGSIGTSRVGDARRRSSTLATVTGRGNDGATARQTSALGLARGRGVDSIFGHLHETRHDDDRSTMINDDVEITGMVSATWPRGKWEERRGEVQTWVIFLGREDVNCADTIGRDFVVGGTGSCQRGKCDVEVDAQTNLGNQRRVGQTGQYDDAASRK